MTGLLGDTPARDYSRKLELFSALAEPELRRVIQGLGLKPGMQILDAGCGSGHALPWLFEAVKPSGRVLGIDLAAAHVEAARRHASADIEVIEADLLTAPIGAAAFDFIWCVNTVNHLHQPTRGVSHLLSLLRPGGRIALGQSSFLPDMYFAWDSRLERLTNEAVHRYYRDRYGLEESDLAGVRALVGIMRGAGARNVAVQTMAIERISPLDSAAESYLSEAVFGNTWGQRLRPYLADEDFSELTRLCDPRHPHYALARPDFHFLQTLTVATGER